MTYVDSKSIFSLFRNSTGLGGWVLSRRVLFVTALLLISMLASPQFLSAQTSKKVITKSAFRNTSIHTADLNGDGSPEVLFGAVGGMQGDGLLAWHENQMSDGQSGGRDFGVPKKLIARHGDKYIATADFDGDGDLDILTGFSSDLVGTKDSKKISWFKNRTGTENADFDGFGPEKTITFYVKRVSSVSVADLDGDGDQDIISAGEPVVAWHENQVGEEGSDEDGFGRQIPVSGDGDAQSVSVGDINGDGNPDVLYSIHDQIADKIAWRENQIGEENADIDGFGERYSIAKQKYLRSVTMADLDGDGDKDILTSFLQPTFGDQDDQDELSGIAWYENQIGETSGSKRFGEQQLINTSEGALSIHAADLDGDGDRDLLAISGKNVFWHRNQIGEKRADSDGFGEQSQILANGGRTIWTADLDGDGDQDILAAGKRKKIYWIENTQEWTSPSK